MLLNIYPSPNSSFHVALHHSNEAIMSIPHLERKDIVITVDFNIDIFNKKHSDAKSLKYFASINSFTQLRECPTRCTLTSSEAIDLIFTNMDYIIKNGTLDIPMRDHQPVFPIKKKPKTHHTPINFLGRTY